VLEIYYRPFEIRLFANREYGAVRECRTKSGSSFFSLLYHYLLHRDGANTTVAEHSNVIASDPQDVAKRLINEPSILSQIPYTVAVIKETMRLYPPTGSQRAGIPGIALTDRHGTQYPCEGFHISTQHNRLHQHPGHWPEADKFLPERWLVPEDHEMYPSTGVFRAFEHGTRNCIGQNLAMLELRIVLALTVRRFEIVKEEQGGKV
jgi:cytochrome P450